jgi:Calcineurin-like phosphoesterase
MDLTQLEPGVVMIAGDWHMHTEWAVSCVDKAAGWLGKEENKIILQLGDFGIWDGDDGKDYLERLSDACEQGGVKIFFIDGNHENHPLLHFMAQKIRPSFPFPEIAPHIFWIDRGSRWAWHERVWMGLGGAVSPDRGLRRLGRSWFEEEEISLVNAASVTFAGTADVMLTHDCPSRVVHSFTHRPSWWLEADLARSDWHREFLQEIVNEVRPSYMFHGHLHRAYIRDVRMKHGDVQVTGLNMDGFEDNIALLDTRTMEFVEP